MTQLHSIGERLVPTPPTERKLPNFLKDTSWYAKKDFIKTQRIIGVALIAIGLLSTFFTAGISGVFGISCVALGGALIGATLIQQVIGDAPDCTKGKVKRVIGGILIMAGGPLGWAIGGLLWHLSNRDNRI